MLEFRNEGPTSELGLVTPDPNGAPLDHALVFLDLVDSTILIVALNNDGRGLLNLFLDYFVPDLPALQLGNPFEDLSKPLLKKVPVSVWDFKEAFFTSGLSVHDQTSLAPCFSTKSL